MTEKLPDAVTGCIPIYWGPIEASKDFNAQCFLDYSSANTIGEFIETIKYYCKSEEAFEKKEEKTYL